MKMTVRWKDVVIEIPITTQQQEIIVKKAMLLIYGETRDQQGASINDFEAVTDEIKHLRTLLLQLNQNRRFLEIQKVQLGPTDIPLRLNNDLEQVNHQIQYVSAKIEELSEKFKSSS